MCIATLLFLLAISTLALGNEVPEYTAYRDPPVYPPQAIASHLEGHVDLLITVSEDGRVISAKVTESVPPGIFDASAIESTVGWHMQPHCGTRFKHPFQVKQTIQFKLARDYRQPGNIIFPIQAGTHSKMRITKDGILKLVRDGCKE
jgi:TonB family protein